jgi:hypothetical protein
VAAPCWQVLLSDSYDGRIDARYPAACFHQLLRALQRQLEGNGPGAPVVARAGGGLPLPLLALGALALVLLAASVGWAGWRRFQAHRGR